jgi:hypothetical protein
MNSRGLQLNNPFTIMYNAELAFKKNVNEKTALDLRKLYKGFC